MRDEIGLRRQWALLRALAGRHQGLTLRQMARELGVTERTVRRDLDTFRGVGFPLEEAVGEYGRKTWRVRAARDQPPLAFTFDEAVALHLGRRLLEPLAGTPFGDAARSAYQKVRAALGPGALEYVERFSGLFHRTDAGLHDYAAKGEVIDALRVGIEDGKVVRMVYRSDGEAGASAREVHPLGLADHRGALYLIGFDPRGGKVKHYKLDRVEAAEVGPDTSQRPEGFDLAGYMAESFGVYRVDGAPTDVKVLFRPEASRYVRESRWHRSLRLTPQPDGGLLAEFRVSGTEEIKRWVLGFGAKAVVLEPGSLRREVAGELSSLAAAYAGDFAGEARPEGAPGCRAEVGVVPPTQGVKDMPVVDLAFALGGTTIPLDYGYALFSALCRVVPGLHGDRRVGVHPIRGLRLGPRQLTLVPQSRLRLRLPSEEIGRYLEIAGATLELDGSQLAVGVPRVEALRPAPSLSARLVTVGRLTDPGAVAASLRAQLAGLGVEGELTLQPSPDPARAGEPTRRVLRIQGRRIVGYAVVVGGLTAGSSLAIQEHGLGSRRRMGCGVFVPSSGR